MEFSFLEFWVPSFFRSKLKGSNTWLEYFGIYRLRSDCIFNTEGGFKYRNFILQNVCSISFIIDALFIFCPNGIKLANYQCVLFYRCEKHFLKLNLYLLNFERTCSAQTSLHKCAFKQEKESYALIIVRCCGV